MAKKEKSKRERKSQLQSRNQVSSEANNNTQSKVGIYNFVQFIRFSAGYYFGVENAFVSLLMVAFGATWNMDRFIWLIPLMMRLVIQPYVYNLIAKSKLCKVYLKAKVIAYLHLVSVFGGGLVIYSSYVSEKDYVSFFFYQKLKRIILSTIGWTSIGICLGISLYLAQQLKNVIEEDPAANQIIRQAHSTPDGKNIVQKELNIVWHQFIRLRLRYFTKKLGIDAIGQTLGYFASFAICLFSKEDSFEEFFKLNNIMYIICALLHLFIFCYLMWKIRNFEQKLQKHPKKRQKGIKLVQSLVKLSQTNFKERIFLTIHFIVYFMTDLFVIFATLWVGAVYPKEFNTGNTYCYGVKIGSLYLVLFMLISNMKMPKIKSWNIEKTLDFLRHYSIFYLLIGVACFTIFEEKSILAFLISGAVLISIYRKKLYPQMMKEHMFQSCVGTVERLQKVFRVSFFPLLISNVFRQKALTSNTIWVTKFFLSFVLICILLFFVDAVKNPLKKSEEQTLRDKAKNQ